MGYVKLRRAKLALSAFSVFIVTGGLLIIFAGLLVRDYDGVMPSGHHLEPVTEQLLVLRDWWVLVTGTGLVLVCLGGLFWCLRGLFRPVVETMNYELLTIAILKEFEHILAGFIHNLKHDLYQVKGISEETAALLVHAPHLLAVVDRVRGDIASATLEDLSALIAEIEAAHAQLPGLGQQLAEYQANLKGIESMVEMLSQHATHLKRGTSIANKRHDELVADISDIITTLTKAGFITAEQVAKTSPIVTAQPADGGDNSQGNSVVPLRGGAG